MLKRQELSTFTVCTYCWHYFIFAFYIFSQQTYLLNFLRHTAQFQFFPSQSGMYFKLYFWVHKIIIFYINGAQKFKSSPEAKGLNVLYISNAIFITIHHAV